MSISRRDIFKFGAGSAAGLAFTPVPWKLLDDTSIWTQNWGPGVPRGEIKTKYSACTLCPAGCGVKARCVGEQPFAVTGVQGHPVSGGRLCPLGVTAHHTAFHPKRIRGAFQRVRNGQRYACVPAKQDATVTAVRNALQTASRAVVLDARPERTASLVFRRAAAALGAAYVPVRCGEGDTIRAVAALTGQTPGSLGFDWTNARTVLSFGTPVLDGASLFGAQLEGKRLIQVEPFLSPTAARADRWLAARPGTEALVALGIAQIVADKGFSLADVAASTGIAKEELEAAAREFADNAPAIAIADAGYTAEEVNAVAALNLISGSVVRRNPTPLPAGYENLPPATELEAIPDGSIDVLIAVEPYNAPAALLRRKLKGDAMVVALASCIGGLTRRADYVIPVPSAFEAMCDTSAPESAALASFGLAPALMTAPAGVQDAAGFFRTLVPDLPDTETVLKARAEAIAATGRGELFRFANAEAAPLKGVSAADFWTALTEGACWVDRETAPFKAAQPGAPAQFIATPKTDAQFSALAVSDGCNAAWGQGPVSPLLTKLHQESELRQGANEACLNPATARAMALEDGCRARVESRQGSAVLRVRVDAGVMPGTVRLACGPSFDYAAGAADPADTLVLSRLGDARAIPVRVSRV